MKTRRLHLLPLLLGSALAFMAGAMFAGQPVDPIPSKVMAQQEALKEAVEWGTFYTYHQGETYGTKDVLTGVAVIKPGWEIHPPHQHAEEEYLMVTDGQGTWHLNGEEFEPHQSSYGNTFRVEDSLLKISYDQYDRISLNERSGHDVS